MPTTRRWISEVPETIPIPTIPTIPKRARRSAALLLLLGSMLGAVDTRADDLEATLGRSEVRVFGTPFALDDGGTVWGYALEERLQARGYRRVSGRPEASGEFFWGHEVFWIYRRSFRHGGREESSRLIGLQLDRSTGTIRDCLGEDDLPLPEAACRLEPRALAESLDDLRARRILLDLDRLPEGVWRPVLAAEDSRFFDHSGVDARSLARALLANLRAGEVAQGGSTITQQLIKNRDLTPRRSLGRKASEAVRALALEAEYDKREILQAYLNQVYLGHVEGLAIHGFGTAAQVYFSKSVEDLRLEEAALLAAMIQGPNRLSPVRHPDRARGRRDWVLSRLEELGWESPESIARAKGRPLGLRRRAPRRPLGGHFLGWVRGVAEESAPRRLAKGRGYVAETSLDPWLQHWAEEAVSSHWRELAPRAGGDQLAIALIALDARTGGVLAHVGGDPAAGVGFDRVRQARRQPGSAVKPLLLLEAFERCGGERTLYPAIRVADEPLRLDLPSGPWEPRNSDGSFRGVVSLREAMVDSLNVPLVRVARHCGFGATARRMRRAGLEVPKPPPPSLSLGSIETSPLELAAAYTVLANDGVGVRPRPVTRLERPEGRRMARFPERDRRVVRAETAFLIADLLRDAAADGTARGVALENRRVAAKTGTTSERRDAWLAGWANGIVTVVWVGRDDAEPLGLTGAVAAAPVWQSFMDKAVGARPDRSEVRPPGIVELWIDPETGLLVRSINPRAERELFQRGHLPRRDRFFRVDPEEAVIR